MYSIDTVTLPASVHNFWDALKGSLPTDFHAQVEGAGDIIEDTTGELTGAWTGVQPLQVVGLVGGSYAAPVGLVVDWLTSTILDGKRVRGKTFVVPVGGSSFESDGSPDAGTIATFQAAGAALIAAEGGLLCVWHRPRVARPADGSRPAVTARAGGHAEVTSCSVPNLAAVLRSRRD